MKWRWLLFDYSDPDLKLTWKQRVRLFRWQDDREPHENVWRWRHPIMWGLAITNTVLMLVQILSMFLMSHLGVSDHWVVRWYLAMFIAYVPALWLGCAVVTGFNRKGIRDALRRQAYEVCTNCGYWLRDLPDDIDRCPECGAEREPRPPGAGA